MMLVFLSLLLLGLGSQAAPQPKVIMPLGSKSMFQIWLKLNGFAMVKLGRSPLGGMGLTSLTIQTQQIPDT